MTLDSIKNAIKANPALHRVPIIAVTSYALSGDDAKALAALIPAIGVYRLDPARVLARS